MNYSISSSSPTEELLTVGQILSEVGNYATTILDREHLSMSRKCMTRLRKVVGELVSRQCIKTADNLYDLPLSAPLGSDLTAMTITELQTLYRRWSIRHKERQAAGRESFSFYYEGRIVRELKKRKAASKADQLKIDYCETTFRNELENMSFLFSRPVKIDDDKIFPDAGRNYTSDELAALIHLYTDFRDIMEREILVEYVDYALDLLEKDTDSVSPLGLLSEIVELGRRKIVHIPEWVTKKLEDSVNLGSASKNVNDAELSLAMLTLHITNNDRTLERKARRIINRCYKSAFDSEVELDKRIESLYTAATCCDYVTRFSLRKTASAWNELSSQALSAGTKLSSRQIFQLLEIAKEYYDYADISAESQDKLKQMLHDMAQSDSPQTKAYQQIVKLSF